MSEIRLKDSSATVLPDTKISSCYKESAKACLDEWLTTASTERFSPSVSKNRVQANKLVEETCGKFELSGDKQIYSSKSSASKEVKPDDVEAKNGSSADDSNIKHEKGRKDRSKHSSGAATKSEYTDRKEYWEGGCKVLEGTDKDGTRLITKVDMSGVTVHREERRKDGSYTLRVENPDGTGFSGEKDSNGRTIKHTSWGPSLLGGSWTIVDNPDGSKECTDGSGSRFQVKPGQPIMVI